MYSVWTADSCHPREVLLYDPARPARLNLPDVTLGLRHSDVPNADREELFLHWYGVHASISPESSPEPQSTNHYTSINEY